MNTEPLTVEQAKDKAAQEWKFDDWTSLSAHCILTEDCGTLNNVVSRAIELHTASALSSVREKLPDHQQTSRREDRDDAYSDYYEQVYKNGAQWAINKVKELLK